MDARRYNPNTVTGEPSALDYQREEMRMALNPAPQADNCANSTQAFVAEAIRRLAEMEARLNRMMDRVSPLPKQDGTRPEEVPSGYVGAFGNISVRMTRIEDTITTIEQHI